MPLKLELKDISKNFGSVRALDHVNLKIQGGEVLALMGENGAGKSTLMKVLSGQYPYSEYGGSILFDEVEHRFDSPADAERMGIAIIHQELSVFPDLTVAENFYVGHWPSKNGLIKSNELNEQAQEKINQLGQGIDVHLEMGSLNTGQQQVVEIAKALAKNAKIVIFDEPTSSLTSQETANLFQLILKLKAEGRAVIYISHRMEEIFKIADRVSVLRDGKSVADFDVENLQETQVIQAMVGRSLEQLFPPKEHRQNQEILFRCKNLKAFPLHGKKHIGPLNFELKKGEILGFAGLLGAGRSEILGALIGAQNFRLEGEVLFHDRAMSFKQLRQAFHAKIGLVTEDRKMMSLLPSRDLEENSSITRLCLNKIFQFISTDEENRQADQELKALKTKYHKVGQLITELSGGNQQKVIFSRVMQIAPELVILDEPTRGVDVGAKYEIYQLIRDWTRKGLSVLLVSSDLPELMALSDRVLVMSNYRQTGILEKHEISQEKIMKLALEGFEKNEKVLAQ